MTTYCQDRVTCGVCGTEHDYPGVESTNAFGSQDLDTRPPEMRRSTIRTWVQCCPECGYCAGNVGQAPEGIAEVVCSPEYRQQLADTSFPALANRFLCAALIFDRQENCIEAIWSMIHAAWACDDAQQEGPAQLCRRNAANRLKDASHREQLIPDQPEAGTAVHLDLLRRSGQFGAALELIETNLPVINEDIIRKILIFQKTLIERGDAGRYTLGAIIGEPTPNHWDLAEDEEPEWF